MFLGHFALAMSAKKIAPKTSLGTLVLSAQFADCLWPVLLLLGLEQVRIVPGITRVTPLDFISYPISHSLLLQLVWGLLLGGGYFFWRRDLRTALVIVPFLAVVYAASLLGPPPPNVRIVALSALALWLTVPWTAWADRQREPRLG